MSPIVDAEPTDEKKVYWDEAELERMDIELSKIRKLPENPNVMTEQTFTELVEKIKDNGFDQEIKVYWNEAEQVYEVIKGNHRYDAALYLELPTVPCVLGVYENRDHAVLDAYSDNLIRGNIDPETFTKHYQEFKEKYGEERVLKLMHMQEEDELKGVLRIVASGLPPDMSNAVKSAAKGATTVKELGSILEKMFDDYGDTLELNFMYFTHGGELHLMITMDDDLRAMMEVVTSLSKVQQRDIGEYLKEAVGLWLEKNDTGGD